MADQQVISRPDVSASRQNVPASPSAEATETGTQRITLSINGQRHELTLDVRTTLLDTLREHLHLTGTKKGCDHGQCGACTVLINGDRANACLALAIMHQDEEITTIEGLAHDGQLHPMQQAFLEHDGFQCGYCTPGQIVSAVAVVEEMKRGDASHVTPQSVLRAGGAAEITEDEVRERMSGNLCRCGAYPNIVDAVRLVSRLRSV